MSLAAFGLIIAILSLVLSTGNAWLTLWRRGTVKMVRPSLAAFVDSGGTEGPKVWLRALIYSTAQRGNVIESLYVRLQRGEARQNFTFWVCGERDKLSAGCGLHVGQAGVALHHHFALPRDGTEFEFRPGEYFVEVVALLVGSRAPKTLARLTLHLSEEHAMALTQPNQDIYFDWWPDSQRYNAHVVRRRESPEVPEIINSIFGSLPSR